MVKYITKTIDQVLIQNRWLTHVDDEHNIDPISPTLAKLWSKIYGLIHYLNIDLKLWSTVHGLELPSQVKTEEIGHYTLSY